MKMTDFDPSSLKYDAQGLIPCIAQQYDTGEVLMMAWMNEASIVKTLESRRVTYWSRSRKSFWVKGDTSGHTQALKSFRMDCDKDCLLALVDQVGAACHTNRRSCFFTEIGNGPEIELMAPIDQ
jgi:phosphoribosyl-AMP cyclohydrolase